jgi:hypothetical protein
MATFLALVEGLIGDPAEKAAYAADPDNYLSSHGFGELDSEDVRTALSHTADAFPPRLAAVIDPDAGLAPVAQVDLGQLGLSGFDEYAPPLDDDLGGAEHSGGDGTDDLADHADDGAYGLHQDVDIDLDGDGIPDAPDAVGDPAHHADDHAAEAVPGHEDDDDDDVDDDDVLDGPAADATPAFATAGPFDDPFADPGLGVDDTAPWMEPQPVDADADLPDEDEEDLLDDAPWTTLGPVDADHLGEF